MIYSTDQYRSIEELAYEFYVKRGRLNGDDLSDWFQAEKTVLKKLSPAVSEGTPKRKTAAPKSDKKQKKTK